MGVKRRGEDRSIDDDEKPRQKGHDASYKSLEYSKPIEHAHTRHYQ